MKTCSKCHIEKPLTEFNKKSSNKDGYNGQCRVCCNLQKKEYYLTNLSYYENYRKNNKDKTKINSKNWVINNPSKNKTNKKQYREKNKEKFKEYYRNYKKERIKTDLVFKLKYRFSKNLYNLFKQNGFIKKSKTIDILGCSFEEFKKYLESKFEDWMTWDNKGLYNGELNYGWDIDHIIPLSTANCEEDIIRLNHYTNLQPLCSFINRNVKRDNH